MYERLQFTDGLTVKVLVHGQLQRALSGVLHALREEPLVVVGHDLFDRIVEELTEVRVVVLEVPEHLLSFTDRRVGFEQFQVF